MKKILIDLNTNAIIGIAPDGASCEKHQLLIDMPDGFDVDEANEWAYDGTGLTRDTVALLDRAKAARKTRIKAEARALIESLDWRLERARERDEVGMGIATRETTSEVLAMREAIRASSSEAEEAVDALTDVASVQSFGWSVV